MREYFAKLDSAGMLMNMVQTVMRRRQDPTIRAEMRREMEKLGGWENWFAHAGQDWDRLVIAGRKLPQHAAMNDQSLSPIARRRPRRASGGSW